MKGVILCAGLGTRLRPFTEHWPKAAIPILGQPLFRFGVELLKGAGIRSIGINTHHLARKMESVASAECARAGIPLTVVHEPIIQGTAGGIRGLRAFLREDDFVALNGDVLFSLELQRIVEAHRRSGALATLVLMPMPANEGYAAVETDDSGQVRRIAGRGPGAPRLRQWHFTGVHVMTPAVFDFMAPDGPEDINRDVYPRMLQKGLLIRGEVVQSYWSDLGTPARYLQAQLDLLLGRITNLDPDASPFSDAERMSAECWVRPDAKIEGAAITGPVFFDEGCTAEKGARVGPAVYVGPRACIRSGARLTRAIVLEETEISGAEDLIDTVAWREHRIQAIRPT